MMLLCCQWCLSHNDRPYVLLLHPRIVCSDFRSVKFIESLNLVYAYEVNLDAPYEKQCLLW